MKYKSCYDPYTNTRCANRRNCPIYKKSFRNNQNIIYPGSIEWLNINQQNAEKCNHYLFDIYPKFTQLFVPLLSKKILFHSSLKKINQPTAIIS